MKKHGWFNIFWTILFFSIIAWLFYSTSLIKEIRTVEYQYKTEFWSGGEVDVERIIQDSLSEINLKYESFRERIELEIEHLHKMINNISLHVGLFATLITAISIFFSLKESSRVDSVIRDYSAQKEKYDEEVKEIERIRNEYSTTINEVVLIKQDLIGKLEESKSFLNVIKNTSVIQETPEMINSNKSIIIDETFSYEKYSNLNKG
ncbi:hypothetical protein [Bibersteinia trehalosi]|uniref:hypothetical protein n=1 Tax=Bibersteinia trehalosi TaxID=47735 RepID=UPI002D77814B|nr:hypothetical protein [Bibersteinia trehalosi]